MNPEITINNVDDVFKAKEKSNQQMLYRESEVENLHKIIYETESNTNNDERAIDCNRYDVGSSKLDIFRNPQLKKMLKSKFVTGQTQDQIVKNLLNMSDSDNEDKDIDKEQLRKIEQNDIKGDKKAKRKKRLENDGKTLDESGSEAEDSEEGSELEDGKKKEKVVEHAPIKKTNDEIKKSQFLGEKFGHFKIGTYLRLEIKVDK